MINLRKILSYNFNTKHFLLVLIITSAITFGLLILSILLGWLFFMEPPAGSRMFSDLVLFTLITLPFLVSAICLLTLNKTAVKSQKQDYQKTYLIVGIILLLTYLSMLLQNMILNSPVDW